MPSMCSMLVMEKLSTPKISGKGRDQATVSEWLPSGVGLRVFRVMIQEAINQPPTNLIGWKMASKRIPILNFMLMEGALELLIMVAMSKVEDGKSLVQTKCNINLMLLRPNMSWNSTNLGQRQCWSHPRGSRKARWFCNLYRILSKIGFRRKPSAINKLYTIARP